MKLQFKGRPVQIELASNADGSRFAAEGYYDDGDFLPLTDDELDHIQIIHDSEINADWRG